MRNETKAADSCPHGGGPIIVEHRECGRLAFLACSRECTVPHMIETRRCPPDCRVVDYRGD